MSVSELKAQGNASFAAKDYNAAIQHYTAAIEVAEKTGEKDGIHVLYSNRSASHAGLKEWDAALKDAEATIQANETFAKGYGRKGSALHGARKYDEAIAAYETGLAKCPGDAALQKGLADVKHAQADSARDPAAAMGNMFRDPLMFEKLSRNPNTAGLMQDAAFVQQLKDLQAGRSNPMMALQDPRMLQVMGALMGIDMKAFERPEGEAMQTDEPAPKEETKPAPKEEPKPCLLYTSPSPRD